MASFFGFRPSWEPIFGPHFWRNRVLAKYVVTSRKDFQNCFCQKIDPKKWYHFFGQKNRFLAIRVHKWFCKRTFWHIFWRVIFVKNGQKSVCGVESPKSRFSRFLRFLGKTVNFLVIFFDVKKWIKRSGGKVDEFGSKYGQNRSNKWPILGQKWPILGYLGSPVWNTEAREN